MIGTRAPPRKSGACNALIKAGTTRPADDVCVAAICDWGFLVSAGGRSYRPSIVMNRIRDGNSVEQQVVEPSVLMDGFGSKSARGKRT